MIGALLETIFTRCFVIIKLNLFCIALTLIGLIVVGIGPALLTINQLFCEQQWDYKQITWKKTWVLYKQNWPRANQLFFTFAAVGLFIGYSLYLAVQVQGVIFLIIDFILVFVMLALFITYSYAIVLNNRFEISFLNLIKLACITFYSNFFMLIKLIISIGFVLVMTYQFPGLLMFASLALIQIICVFTTKKWIVMIERKIVVEGD
ncbi:YesL family protein [Brochothrix campestris]|uniref:DUF624 domain-containing protein n=1 Tax=Brochothrix campestris FSL F6-1037 TaxID=1265861 RepID=W7D9Z5_9LIST|nr:DUF624 domain-containing protein [Brochothrix campestris]EUJ42088.1 hypothetical protein BCAMP_00610 [Brochothrix campestris FSL F6-1037]